jgi:hypothetical protein
MDLTRQDYNNLYHNDSASIEESMRTAIMMKRPKFKIHKLTKSQAEAALGATFEILFRKKHPDVKYFIFFCNLVIVVNILHAGPAAAATKIKIQIRGFLQLGKSTLATALENLLKCFPISTFLSDKWERCKGGLYGNKEYETCRAENSPWMPVQTRGDFGNSNKGKAANKSPQTAVIASSESFRCIVVCFPFELTSRAAGQGPPPQA